MAVLAHESVDYSEKYERRDGPRVPTASKEIRFYALTNIKYVSASVMNESPNGMGCFCVSSTPPIPGEELTSTDLKKFNVRWVKELSESIFMFGLETLN